ncbi:MAG: hypothetical protein NTZ09_17725 [Candidatus Hydrogenedentes bacterium]|nr:hypothetical protein [Candidatus Hydrogenedentota bacterium]
MSKRGHPRILGQRPKCIPVGRHVLDGNPLLLEERNSLAVPEDLEDAARFRVVVPALALVPHPIELHWSRG